MKKINIIVHRVLTDNEETMMSIVMISNAFVLFVGILISLEYPHYFTMGFNVFTVYWVGVFVCFLFSWIRTYNPISSYIVRSSHKRLASLARWLSDDKVEKSRRVAFICNPLYPIVIGRYLYFFYKERRKK